MQRLQTIRLPFSANIKLLLVTVALAIVAGTLYYVQMLVDDLRRAEQQAVSYYAESLQLLLSAPQGGGSDFVVNELALKMAESIYFPVILADGQRHPSRSGVSGEYEWDAENIEIDTTLSESEQEGYLVDRITDMEDAYEPLVIYSITTQLEEISLPLPGADTLPAGEPRDTLVLQEVTDTSIAYYLYYEDSAAITRLQLLPWIELLIITMFIIIGYVGFSHIKRSEQSNIWVGMAKETAHQLGTPLSSLLGWIELLRFEPENRVQVLEAADEMSRDVDRLTTVAQRFSKIGSAATTKPYDLNEVIAGVVTYFERRLPHLGKRVSLGFTPHPEPLVAAINIDLIRWVFENLVRNAADAIDRREGRIDLSVRPFRDTIIIEVADNGRGIDPKIRKDIFRPGFSTKERGWGLGLSLARRIIEEYHGGKINVRESSAEGTKFEIRLNRGEV